MAQSLISSGNAKSRAILVPERKAPGNAKAKGKSNSKGKGKGKKASLADSSLKLDIARLKQLATYCSRFELKGTEQIAFVLINFAREHTDLKFVTDADVAWLHRQLISQRVKVAAVNNPSHWTRALYWLTAPSRHKEWLESSGDGYVVSNSGLIRWHELEEQAKARKETGAA